ncbi:MAG: alanine racemase [Pirellulales bacterium]|nr:alanine racemase [Pirellulales bacterium]
MKADFRELVQSHVDRILEETIEPLPEEIVRSYISQLVERQMDFMALVQRHGSPLYVFDQQALQKRARKLQRAFERVLPQVSCFFAMKSNNHPLVAATLVEEHFGLDVSSGTELHAAIVAGAEEIMFSGPGKTQSELTLALEHADRVTMLIDSFGEFERLQAIACDRHTPIRAGVRITPPTSTWRKFGIPLEELLPFWEKAKSSDFVHLCGIQFHSSWNHHPTNQIATIQAIGRAIRLWPKSLLDQITFLDIGGGFWPPQGEWLLHKATRQGKLLSFLEGAADPIEGRCLVPATPIDSFAEQLATSLEENIFDLVKCRICIEPGRWICNDAMHLLLTVVDKKDKNLVIVDAGTNAIGWERFESDYAPIVNLSRPAETEHPCQIYGSLCTPEDVWGYAYWGEDILPGDVLLVPDQGAYTYSLRQYFIKPVPPVIPIK